LCGSARRKAGHGPLGGEGTGDGEGSPRGVGTGLRGFDLGRADADGDCEGEGESDGDKEGEAGEREGVSEGFWEGKPWLRVATGADKSPRMNSTVPNATPSKRRLATKVTPIRAHFMAPHSSRAAAA
jgi:hypothetical protein